MNEIRERRITRRYGKMINNIQAIPCPNEIMEKVFSFLDRKSLQNSLLVCKHWNEIISSSSKIMKNLPLVLKNSNPQQNLEIKEFTRKYQAIEFHNFEGSIRKKLKSQLLEIINNARWITYFGEDLEIFFSLLTDLHVEEKFPNLKEIKVVVEQHWKRTTIIYNSPFDRFQEFYLKKIEIENIYNFYGPLSVSELSKLAPEVELKMKKLTIQDNFGLIVPENRNSRLNSLLLDDFLLKDPEEILIFNKIFPNIKKLQLLKTRPIFFLMDVFEQEFFENFKNLEELTIDFFRSELHPGHNFIKKFEVLEADVACW
jgi:hypothetical protein